MAVNQNFLVENSSGFRMGLRNLLKKENNEWWGTNRWWIQAIIWSTLIVGLTASTLIGLPRFAEANGEFLDVKELVLNSVQILFGLGSLASAIGIIIITQSEIIGEKQNGTAGWILSKPISRTAFYLSKLLSNGFSTLILMVGLPLTLGYVLFLTQKYPIELSNFLIAAGLMIIHSIFYLSLSLLLGVFSEKRGVILAGTLGVLLGGQVLSGILKFLVYILPVALPQIMPAIVIDGPASIPTELWIPVAVTFIWSLFFIGLSIHKIQRLEF